MKSLLVNTAWHCMNLPGYLAFKRGIRNIRRSQTRRMLRIISAAANTEYGRKFNFSDIKTPDDFRKNVPIVEYRDIEPYITAIAEGRKDVLFPGKPLCLEPTSGTGAANKLIPYNQALHREFQAGIAPWIFDMFANNPGLMKGTAYWSISPALQPKKLSPGGIPIGFRNDMSYLNLFMRHALKQIMVLSDAVAGEKTMDEFYLSTQLHLLSAKKLSLISVWNPSYLLIILDILNQNKDVLLEKLSRKRADELRNIMHNNLPRRYSEIWPNLKVLSCWVDGAAAIPAEQLRNCFPGVKIVPKGLLATEGFITFPLENQAAPALAVNSHFYEFIPIDNPDKIMYAWELEEGKRYSVVISTGGGLYRYRLHDIVEVKGFYHECPLLRLIGRDNATSDICGEKLHETLVLESLKEVFADKMPGFSLLAPTENHYVLYLAGCTFSDAELQEKILRFDKLLCRNFHYEYCRKLRQLSAVKFTVLDISPKLAMRKYSDYLIASGQKAGDIKPAVLSNKPTWHKILLKR